MIRGGVDPDPPHREHPEPGVQRSERREVREQPVREPGHREDEDQIEEQLR